MNGIKAKTKRFHLRRKKDERDIAKELDGEREKDKKIQLVKIIATHLCTLNPYFEEKNRDLILRLER